MPYFNEQNILDEEQQREQQLATQQPLRTATQGATIQGSSQQPTGAPGPDQASSTNFTNVQRYVDANQGNTKELTDQVTGRIGQAVGQAQESLQQAPQNIDTYFTENLPQENGIIEQAAQDPTAIANDPERFAQFQSVRDAQYQGADNFNETEIAATIRDYISGARRYEDIAQNAQTRRRALEDIQENDRGGVTTFNNLLLQNDPNSRQALTQASQPIGGLQGQYDQARDLFTQGVQGARDQAEAYRQQVQDTFLGEGGVRDQFRSDLDQRLADTRSEAEGLTESLTDAAGDMIGQGRYQRPDNRLTETQISQLGLTPEQYNQILSDFSTLYNAYQGAGYQNMAKMEGISDEDNFYKYASKYADPTRFLSAGNPESEITRNRVATAEDLAQQEAINQLMGIDEAYIADNELIGTANSDLIDFNIDDYEEALAAAFRKLGVAQMGKGNEMEQEYPDWRRQAKAGWRA